MKAKTDRYQETKYSAGASFLDCWLVTPLAFNKRPQRTLADLAK